MKDGFQVQTVLEAGEEGGGGCCVGSNLFFSFLLQQSKGIQRLGMCERVTS